MEWSGDSTTLCLLFCYQLCYEIWLCNHEIRLKVGALVILLRNVDKKNYDYAMEQD